MRYNLDSNHYMTGPDEIPGGGNTSATGLSIEWQEGPLGRGPDRLEPNGCFVETVIAAAVDRLQFYQRSKFSCEENGLAINHLMKALNCLNKRTSEREACVFE